MDRLVEFVKMMHGDFVMTKPAKPSDLFPDRLRKARDLRGLSQVDLAQRAGLPASSISHFEAGSRKPSFDNLRRLASTLAVSTDFLLGRVEEAEATAAADPLYRDFKNLSAEDRELTKGFMEMLAERSRRHKGGRDE
jgi:transcriptional regulator with XRE-family HTH domain